MVFIYSWPSWLVLVVEVAAFAGLSLLGQELVRRTVPTSHLAKHNDVTGFVLAIVGVIYAVLLAFVVVVAWEGYNAAERTVRDEVAAASDLYRVVGTLPEAERRKLRTSILDYARVVQQTEWPAMQTGRENPEAQSLSEEIVKSTIEVADLNAEAHRVTGDQAVTLARAFIDARRQRLAINDEGIPSALWSGLILGAIITISFTFLFGVENRHLQRVITVLLSSLIAVMFSMIVVLDYPFRGETSVSPEPWHIMVNRIHAEHLKP